MEHTKKHRIGIVDFSLVDQGLSHLEALVYQYVQRFEKNKRPCFASIPYIASELRLSERSTKRHIKRLIAINMLRETTKGRGRYLNTTGAKMAPMNGAKNVTTGAKLSSDRCQNGTSDRCQIGPLPLKVLPIEIYQEKVPPTQTSKNQEHLSAHEREKLEFFNSTGINWDEIPE